MLMRDMIGMMIISNKPVVLFERNIIQNMIRLPRNLCMFLLVYDG